MRTIEYVGLREWSPREKRPNDLKGKSRPIEIIGYKEFKKGKRKGDDVAPVGFFW